ncbi:MAG: hypothetical protein AAGG08_02965 [Actinomycetota bacterium]
MKDLLELSLLSGLMVGPMLLRRRSAACVARTTVGFCAGYTVLAIYVLPRLPG